MSDEMPADPLANHPVSVMTYRSNAVVKRLLEYESHRDVLREIKQMSRDDLEAMAIGYVSDVMRSAPSPDGEHEAALRFFRWLQVGESRD